MRRLALALAAIGLAQGAAAQERVIENPAERFLERQREQERFEELERARPRPEFEEERPARTNDARCFDIETITVDGVTILPNDRVEATLRPYQGRCLNADLINALMADINALYHRRGYVTTRTYLPQQSLASGALALLVIEGRVEGFQIDGEPADDDWRVLSAFPIRPGDLLDLTRIEQGLDQMNRLAGREATLQLAPGAETGGSIVDITITDQDMWRLSAGYDNAGQESTGLHRVRVGFAQDDLFGVNDAWSITALGSISTNAVAASTSVPIGRWTLRQDTSYSEYLTDLADVATLYGQFFSARLEADYMAYRDGERKTHLFGAVSRSVSARFIDDIELTPQRLASIQFGVRHTELRDWGVMAADAAIVFGVSGLGGDSDPPDIQREAAHAQFAKLEAGWLGVFPLPEQERFKARAILSGRAQWTNVGLFGPQLITMGDVGTVRGFAESPVAGERGLYARNEIAAQPTVQTGIAFADAIIAGTEVYAFIDGGVARLLAAEKPGWVVGAGGGVRVSAHGAQGDIALAYPLAHSPLEETPLRMYMTVGATF